jgi:mediator of RNA polymerase II transcription subunit 5
MSLKTLCSHLAQKPSSLDVLLLFDKPSTILQPICHLLDGWRYEEDQEEYQPAYEEFGSILLLVLAFVYRYDLSTFDLGIQGNDSFIAKLLARGSISRSMDELSELEKKQLDGWIQGLYNAEGGGLGDEPMSNCPPQDFYLLVPTFFSNVMLAYHSGYISDDILKGGLECESSS